MHKKTNKKCKIVFKI